MTRLRFREALNVSEFKERDELIRRARQLRDEAVLARSAADRWNRLHPDEEQVDTAFEDAVIAWCDGEGDNPFTTEEHDHAD